MTHFPILASLSSSTKLFSRQCLVPTANNSHELCHVCPAMCALPCVPCHDWPAVMYRTLSSCDQKKLFTFYLFILHIASSICFYHNDEKSDEYTDTLLKGSLCRCYSLIFMCGETTHFTVWLSFWSFVDKQDRVGYAVVTKSPNVPMQRLSTVKVYLVSATSPWSLRQMCTGCGQSEVRLIRVVFHHLHPSSAQVWKGNEVERSLAPNIPAGKSSTCSLKIYFLWLTSP